MESQKNFINQNLKFDSTCMILNYEYISKISLLKPPMINKIIREKFNEGPAMKAILCLFNTLLNSNIKVPENNALYFPTIKIQNWINKMTPLNVESVEGIIYITNIFSNDIEVIIKVPKKNTDLSNLKREYFISLRSINNLRYIVPTFAYTFGA